MVGGIGKACCKQLIEDGYFIIGIGRNLDEIPKEWRNDCFAGIEVDLLSNIDKIPELIENIVDKYGPLDGFVHCAGFDKMVPLGLAKAKDMEKLWRIHAQVPMLIISTMSKKKRHGENTSIVLISSQSAHEGAMGHSVYASAKGAIEGFLPPASAELMEKNIRINVICFSLVKTKMISGWIEKLTDESKQRLINSYPMGLMSVDDAATYITFLLSEKSKYINGQIITIDAGHAVRKV